MAVRSAIIILSDCVAMARLINASALFVDALVSVHVVHLLVVLAGCVLGLVEIVHCIRKVLLEVWPCFLLFGFLLYSLHSSWNTPVANRLV